MFATSQNRAALGVVLIAFGALTTGLGAWAWSVCTSSFVNGAPPDCGGFAIPVVFGIILLIVGIVVAVSSAVGGRRTIYPSSDPAVPPPLIQPVLVQQTIVQPTVEVRCRYCGGLNPVTATTCSACGAGL